jgi:hypothetical protein
MTPVQNDNRVTENASLSVIDMKNRNGKEMLNYFNLRASDAGRT